MHRCRCLKIRNVSSSAYVGRPCGEQILTSFNSTKTLGLSPGVTANWPLLLEEKFNSDILWIGL